MNKLQCIYTIDYYTSGKRGEPLIHGATGMNGKIIMLSESQMAKNTYYIIPFMNNF